MDEIDSHHDNFAKLDGSLVERIEHVYLILEMIAQKDSSNLSNGGKANLRRAQAEIQRIRLLLYELNGKFSKKEYDNLFDHRT